MSFRKQDTTEVTFVELKIQISLLKVNFYLTSFQEFTEDYSLRHNII